MTWLGSLADSAAVHALGWALVHFIWQALLVSTTARAILTLLHRATPRWRYGVGTAALCVVTLLPAVTAWWVLHSWRAARPLDPPGGSDAAALGVGAGRALLESVAQGYDALQPLLPWLVAAWVIGVLVGLGRLRVAWLRIRRLVVSARPAPPSLREGLATLSRCHRLRIPIEIGVSPGVSVPTVIGVRRSHILIPTAVASRLADHEIATILAHELAHVHRRDGIVNLAQCLIEVLFFFHPSVSALSSVVRREREFCCDDFVVQSCGSALTYARALVTVEELRRSGGRLALASTDGPLLARILRLLKPGTGNARSSILPVLGRVLGLLAGLAAAVRVFAAPYAGGAALPPALRVFAGPVHIRAHDPAGPFTLTVLAGRVVAATIDGVSVPPDRLVQVGDSLRFLDARGDRDFAVALKPRGGISWIARPPRPVS